MPPPAAAVTPSTNNQILSIAYSGREGTYFAQGPCAASQTVCSHLPIGSPVFSIKSQYKCLILYQKFLYSFI